MRRERVRGQGVAVVAVVEGGGAGGVWRIFL